MEALKAAEKKGKISQDEQKRFETDVQKITDKAIIDIDAATAAKEKEILGK
jgi:ribosome recycling factor